MKTSRGFTQPNRIPSFLRFGSGLTLIAAAAAMAFVAVNPSGPLSSAKKSTSADHAKISMDAFRGRLEALETSLGATRSGEPAPRTGRSPRP